jgi:hypothetical protein
MIVIPHNKISVVQHYCIKNISPRQYYFHHMFGGDGWEFTRSKDINGWTLKIDDPKLETYIELKFI